MSSYDPDRDYPRAQGHTAVGARLRRLSERIDREADQVYRSLGLRFEQRWFGVLNLLSIQPGIAVGDLAERLGISHAAVSQTRASLEREGLIASTPDPRDSRRSLLRLSDAGEALVAQLQPVWAALSAASADLAHEAPGLVEALDRLDQGLRRIGLTERTLAHLRDPSRSPD